MERNRGGLIKAEPGEDGADSRGFWGALGGAEIAGIRSCPVPCALSVLGDAARPR